MLVESQNPKQRVTYRPRSYLSVSTLLSFSRCPRRYFFSKCGLTTETLALAPNYGLAMHAAVPVALLTEDFDLAYKEFIRVWAPIEAEIDKLGEGDDKKHNRRSAERSLKHFIHTHKGSKSIYKLTPPPAGTLESDAKTSDYEVPWALDIGLPIPLVGRFDSLCEHRDTKESWIWELKTTSRLSSAFFNSHEMNVQNLVYALAGRTLTGENIQGVIVEGMLKDPKKVDNQAQPIPVATHHLEAILRWLFITGKRLLDAEKAYLDGNGNVDAFYQDFSMCTPYAHFYMPGFFRCEYADLCRVEDFNQLTPFYAVTPEHNFLEVTIDQAAKTKPKPKP